VRKEKGGERRERKESGRDGKGKGV